MLQFNARETLQEYRAVWEKSSKLETRKILVCGGTGCIAGGSLQIYDRLKELLEENCIDIQLDLTEEPHKDVVGLKRSGCHGFCEMGPLIRIEPQGWLYTKCSLSDCEEIVRETILGGRCIERLAYKQNEQVYEKQEDIPFYKKQTRLVLEHCGHINAYSIKDYIAAGGFTALEKALFDMTPDEITKEVTASDLRGRGGAGFPAGRKWDAARKQKEFPKYIICNGDEGDPGAFMDRSVMEGDPFRLLEGMIIAGIAVGAAGGYIYVRAEYPVAVSRLKNAIDECNQYGILGDQILGSNVSFHIHINRGAGAFVCGEGSALIASIEGQRGMPRVKPPRMAEKGLFGKPTVLNNVETLANVPAIIERGSKWYRSFGTENSPGTKAFALTGNINNTGLIEVPMGTTLREIIFDIGGGMRGGKKFKAVQIGGPSGGCLTEKDLDLPLDFDSLKKAGAMIGSGGLVVMDEDTCMVETARFFMHFTHEESCGKCVPCREGTKRMYEILERIVDGQGHDGDIELLEDLADTVKNCSLCGLGQSAPNPVLSTIKNFRDEYEAHIYQKRCPTGKCVKLRHYVIDPSLCRGCSKCARNCPQGAIHGEIKKPFVIDQEKCIRCGACMLNCNFQAVRIEV
ncbi:MAG: NADH-quinone oxidoreductase subunit NuoF [Eubacteriales bacterium]|nr:NADH-quinone oxidoreductase subunit NuoF [Eubacteriales bacterium]